MLRWTSRVAAARDLTLLVLALARCGPHSPESTQSADAKKAPPPAAAASGTQTRSAVPAQPSASGSFQGLRLTYAVNGETVDRAVALVNARLARIGFKQVRVERHGSEIQVDAPNLLIEDHERLRQTLLTRGILEVKLCDDAADPFARFVGDAAQQIAVLDERVVDEHGVEHQHHYGAVKALPGESNEASLARLAAWAQPAVIPKGSQLAFGESPRHGAFRWRTYLVERDTRLTNDAVADVKAIHDPERAVWRVLVELGLKGAAQLSELTANHTHQRLAVTVDGTVLIAATIGERIEGGTIAIVMDPADGPSEGFRRATALATTIRMGPIPELVPLNEVVVGPSKL